MRRLKAIALVLVYFLAVVLLARFVYLACNGICHTLKNQNLILKVANYHDGHFSTIGEQLAHRIKVQPFNLLSLLLFVLAIIHTFFAHYFTVLSKKFRERNIKLNRSPVDSFGVEFLRFMGEVEVVFGLWVIPLFFAMLYTYDWTTAVSYLNNIDYVEPMFVVVIMALASTAPIIRLAEDALGIVARIGGGSVRAWWWSLLTLGPISGSFITEPGAMTITAVLLAKRFYSLGPSKRFAYATLGLLFTNISVGGVLTNFAAPPVLMVSKNWNWDTTYMLSHFGWKAFVGILIANLIYYFGFREEFNQLEDAKSRKQIHKSEKKKIPFWISFVHILFLAWAVAHSHYPVIFVGSFLLFMGFYQATLSYQKAINLRSSILVGFFLAGLVIHGTLQTWWIQPLLENATGGALLLLSAFLTSFNDNAEITFLASLIPTFNESLKYAVVAGAVSGGGLTVIANAPNPSGQSILQKYFEEGISALSLLFAAIGPAMIMLLSFYFLKEV